MKAIPFTSLLCAECGTCFEVEREKDHDFTHYLLVHGACPCVNSFKKFKMPLIDIGEPINA